MTGFLRKLAKREAWQLPNNREDLVDASEQWVRRAAKYCELEYNDKRKHWVVVTAYGRVSAPIGAWLILEPDESISLLSERLFEMSYERWEIPEREK